MSEIGMDDDSMMENIKEKALKELSIKPMLLTCPFNNQW